MEFQTKTTYFQFISDICKILNWPQSKGKDIVDDVNFFACWDDGMTPEQTIDEARSQGVLTDKNEYFPENYNEN